MLQLKDIKVAKKRLKGIVHETPMLLNNEYSETYDCNVFFKREDMQIIRSYKIRGAYNKVYSLSNSEKTNGIVCASAGNHGQGFAFSCNKLKIKGTVYMPVTTPKQKINQVKMFGKNYIDIILAGDTFDDCQKVAKERCKEKNQAFIHPFDDPKIIEGQATLALEILKQTKKKIDYLFVPVGGGGLISGILIVFKALSPDTKIIGVEPLEAASMSASLKEGKNIKLETISKFVDGAAVQQVGDITFDICQKHLDKMVTVPEGKTCQIILNLYNKQAMVVEPAGTLSIAALDNFKEEIKGKNVCCIISGSNNDIIRTPEIKEKALLYANLKHYFIINFPQRAGALKEFVVEILGENDDITYFEYQKKNNKENSAAVVGIELKNKRDFEPLLKRMKERNFYGDYLNNQSDLFKLLI